MELILYSTHCPRCEVLAKKLQQKGLKYKEINDIDEMLALGIQNAPALGTEVGILDFSSAIKWINAQEVTIEH